MTDFEAVIRTFGEAGVECVVVGGLAAAIHGSARLTQDIDFVYSRAGANIDRLVAALQPHAPYPRGAPPGLPFDWSRATIERGLDFTLTTAIGDIRSPPPYCRCRRMMTWGLRLLSRIADRSRSSASAMSRCWHPGASGSPDRRCT